MQDEDDPPLPDLKPAADAYAAAMGKFLIAFNAMDYQLAELIHLILRHHGHDTDFADEVSHRASFNSKVTHLQLMSLPGARHRLDKRLVDKLKSIQGFRNRVAHGHFDQNPFDASYVVIGQKERIAQLKSRRNPKPKEDDKGEQKKLRPVDPAQLDRFAADCYQAISGLQNAEAFYWFDDLAEADRGDFP